MQYPVQISLIQARLSRHEHGFLITFVILLIFKTAEVKTFQKLRPLCLLGRLNAAGSHLRPDITGFSASCSMRPGPPGIQQTPAADPSRHARFLSYGHAFPRGLTQQLHPNELKTGRDLTGKRLKSFNRHSDNFSAKGTTVSRIKNYLLYDKMTDSFKKRAEVAEVLTKLNI